MKIEIVPEMGKRSRKDDSSGFSFGWIFDTMLGSFRSVVDTVSKSIAEGIEEIFVRAARQAFLIILVVMGFIYVLNGFAGVLNTLYGVPGIGELVVGVIILVMGFILSILWKK